MMQFRYTLNRFVWTAPRIPTAGIVLLVTTLVFFSISLKATQLYASEAQPQTTIVRFPSTAAEGWRSTYTIQLLQLALSKVSASYRVQPSEIPPPPKARNFIFLQKDQNVDVVWSMTREDREERFLPIRIPIFKGLSGWRISLVHESNREQFEGISTIDELKMLSVGQVHAWTDTKIFTANGFEVNTGGNYDSMFRMLKAKRFDYFPRSTAEALNEYEQHKSEKLVIEPYVVIHYPTAMYYFVNKENTALAKAIEKGLEIAIKDGSFDTLFFKHHSRMLEQAKLHQRKVFYLKNPLLPKATPLQRKELWLDPLQ